MSTSEKPRTKTTTSNDGNCPKPKTGSVFNIIKSQIQSELISAKERKKYILLGKDGKPQCYRAEFQFEGNLRRYQYLQNQVSGEKRRFSNLLTFTSPDVGADALALPASIYVSNTWGGDGTKILQMVDNAMRATKIQGVSATLTHGCQIAITVNDNNLHLKIKGKPSSFVRVIEQICWLVSVAGYAATKRLEKYLEETKRGTTTREYAESIYTGAPVLTAEDGPGCCFHVSFSAAEIENEPNRKLVARSGHCWKTMTGMSIIANGFVIPSRPRHGSGLEAPLFVLRRLFKRGCHGKSPMALDSPLVMYPPSRVSRRDTSGKVAHVDALRVILAAACERKDIYWHFDPARVCSSLESFRELGKEIRVHSSAIDSNSRHFVGWSDNVGHLAAAPSDIPVPYNTDESEKRRPHWELILTTFTFNLRLPGVVGLSATVARDDLDTMTRLHQSLTTRASKIHYLSTKYFVLWDKLRRRGWLVRGETAALHLLRVKIKEIEQFRSFDFSSLPILKDVADDISPAYQVLAYFCPEDALAQPNDAEEKPGNSESGDKPKTREEKIKESIGEKFDELVNGLFKLFEDVEKLNPHRGLLGQFRTWYGEMVGHSLRGWDFKSVAISGEAKIEDYKMHKDPGWLQMVREKEPVVLFGDGFGEVLEPRAGSCCPYFPTLPIGKNLLACNMQVIRQLVNRIRADVEFNPPDKTVARLSLSQAWVRDLDPFRRPNCQGDHLDTLEPSCFPVQGLQDAPPRGSPEKRQKKDMELLEGKKSKSNEGKRLYAKKEIQDMIAKHPRGVVVFGSQLGPEELRSICRRNPQNRDPAAQEKESTASTAASSANRPSSRDPAHVSTGRPALPSAAAAVGTGQHARPTGQRTPSNGSVRSTVSNAQSRASGNGTGDGQPQASKPKSSAPSVQKATSSASLRSNGSSVHLKASQVNSTGAGLPESSTSQSPATALRKATSSASLRSTNSTTRHRAPDVGSGRSNEPSPQPGTRKVTSKSSSSSVRTTSSVASGATGGSQPQRPSAEQSAQPSAMGLKKTVTNSSDRTTGSNSSSATHNSAAGGTAARNRQRQQQQLEQASNATAAAGNLAPGQPISSNHGTSPAGTTGNPHSTSSGPASTAAGGPDGSS